jgi:hypothetical protein
MVEVSASSVPWHGANRRDRPRRGCTRLSRKFDLLILCARIGFRP